MLRVFEVTAARPPGDPSVGCSAQVAPWCHSGRCPRGTRPRGCSAAPLDVDLVSETDEADAEESSLVLGNVTYSTEHAPMLALTIRGSTEYLDEANQEEAMSRYWKARQDGDTTAALQRIDTPTTTPTPSTEAGQVSPVAKARIEAQEQSLTKAGFSLAPPLFAAGTRVLPLGDRNFRLERTRVEALPPYREAAAGLTSTIAGEDRRDVELLLRDVRLDEGGAIVLDGTSYPFTEDAFAQLVALMGIGHGARYLALCPTDLRATNVNRQAIVQRNRTLRLRTRRTLRGTREVYAVVTPSYAVVDSDALVGVAADSLADARAEVVYDGAGAKVTALFLPDAIVDLAAGDVFKVGVQVSTDDTGRGRIKVAAVAFRNRCLNLLVIGEGTVETVSAVHKGDPARILDTVRDGVNEAREKIADFLEAWGHARKVVVDVAATLRAWVDERKLGAIPARDRDQAVEALLGSWQKEPGDTLADAVNAVSRSAHESDFWSRDLRAELEARAASLVLVPR